MEELERSGHHETMPIRTSAVAEACENTGIR